MVTSLSFVTFLSAKKDRYIVKAESDVFWFHYDAVEPTLNKHGSKEFWANCSTHLFSLTKPEGETIFEGVSFDTTTYFDDLVFGDERYIPSVFETENAVHPSFDGSTFSYGIYPQTRVKDESLISSLSE